MDPSSEAQRVAWSSGHSGGWLVVGALPGSQRRGLAEYPKGSSRAGNHWLGLGMERELLIPLPLIGPHPSRPFSSAPGSLSFHYQQAKWETVWLLGEGVSLLLSPAANGSGSCLQSCVAALTLGDRGRRPARGRDFARFCFPQGTQSDIMQGGRETGLIGRWRPALGCICWAPPVGQAIALVALSHLILLPPPGGWQEWGRGGD